MKAHHLLFCLAGLAPAWLLAAPSADALLLTEKLNLREFSRFLGPPRGLGPKQLETLEARFGIDALMQQLALHFETKYSSTQLKGMLSLWNDPNMQLLVGELMGTRAPINQLLSKWTTERQQLIAQMRKESAAPSKPESATR